MTSYPNVSLDDQVVAILAVPLPAPMFEEAEQEILAHVANWQESIAAGERIQRRFERYLRQQFGEEISDEAIRDAAHFLLGACFDGIRDQLLAEANRMMQGPPVVRVLH